MYILLKLFRLMLQRQPAEAADGGSLAEANASGSVPQSVAHNFPSQPILLDTSRLHNGTLGRGGHDDPPRVGVLSGPKNTSLPQELGERSGPPQNCSSASNTKPLPGHSPRSSSTRFIPFGLSADPRLWKFILPVTCFVCRRDGGSYSANGTGVFMKYHSNFLFDHELSLIFPH